MSEFFKDSHFTRPKVQKLFNTSKGTESAPTTAENKKPNKANKSKGTTGSKVDDDMRSLGSAHNSVVSSSESNRSGSFMDDSYSSPIQARMLRSMTKGGAPVVTTSSKLPSTPQTNKDVEPLLQMIRNLVSEKSQLENEKAELELELKKSQDLVLENGNKIFALKNVVEKYRKTLAGLGDDMAELKNSTSRRDLSIVTEELRVLRSSIKDAFKNAEIMNMKLENLKHVPGNHIKEQLLQINALNQQLDDTSGRLSEEKLKVNRLQRQLDEERSNHDTLVYNSLKQQQGSFQEVLQRLAVLKSVSETLHAEGCSPLIAHMREIMKDIRSPQSIPSTITTINQEVLRTELEKHTQTCLQAITGLDASFKPLSRSLGDVARSSARMENIILRVKSVLEDNKDVQFLKQEVGKVESKLDMLQTLHFATNDNITKRFIALDENLVTKQQLIDVSTKGVSDIIENLKVDEKAINILTEQMPNKNTPKVELSKNEVSRIIEPDSLGQIEKAHSEQRLEDLFKHLEKLSDASRSIKMAILTVQKELKGNNQLARRTTSTLERLVRTQVRVSKDIEHAELDSEMMDRVARLENVKQSLTEENARLISSKEQLEKTTADAIAAGEREATRLEEEKRELQTQLEALTLEMKFPAEQKGPQKMTPPITRQQASTPNTTLHKTPSTQFRENTSYGDDVSNAQQTKRPITRSSTRASKLQKTS